jgi:hypothetical protein
MDPGLEAVRVAKLWELLPGRHEGVLQGILGEPVVAQDPEGDREARIADLVHQAAKASRSPRRAFSTRARSM